jgi:hypothetical protein
MSQPTVSRIWKAFGLKPWVEDTFKLSTDPLFIDKVRDIVALYMNPPERAVVVCVDEKTAVQALDRTQPVLPLLPHTPERHTHDYVRHGTIDLFAALNLATGAVIHQLTARHRAVEFRKFLDLIDRTVPVELKVHVVLDNSSTHKTPAIQRWLVRHPRFEFHFTPTSSSWMNLVERWFAELTMKWLRRGTPEFDSLWAYERPSRRVGPGWWAGVGWMGGEVVGTRHGWISLLWQGFARYCARHVPADDLPPEQGRVDGAVPAAGAQRASGGQALRPGGSRVLLRAGRPARP